LNPIIINLSIFFKGQQEATTEQLDITDAEKKVLTYTSVQGHTHITHAVSYSASIALTPVGQSRCKLTWSVRYNAPVDADLDEAKKFFKHIMEGGSYIFAKSLL